MKEMVGGCCVCSDDRGWAENPLVYCDGQGCTVAVHQACYGIVTVPTGNWYCRKCESQERTARVCELCPSRDGALKRTDNQRWAHVVCALYIPEVRFANVSTMEPIILQQIPPERFNKTCYICEESGKGAQRGSVGACMQCNKSGCKQQFHVTCAQALGLLCEEAGNYLDNVKYCGYCTHHYSKLKKGANVKTIPPYRPVATESNPEASLEKEPAEGWGNRQGKRKLSTSSVKSQTVVTPTGSSNGKLAVSGKPNLSPAIELMTPPITTPSGKPSPPPVSVTALSADSLDLQQPNVPKRRRTRTPPTNLTGAAAPTEPPIPLASTPPAPDPHPPPSVVVKLPNPSKIVTPASTTSVAVANAAIQPSRVITSTAVPTLTSSIVVSVPLVAAALPTAPSVVVAVPIAVQSPATPPPPPDDHPTKRSRSQSAEKLDRGRKQKRGVVSGNGGGRRGGRSSNTPPAQVTPPPTPTVLASLSAQASPVDTPTATLPPSAGSTMIPLNEIKEYPPSSPESGVVKRGPTKSSEGHKMRKHQSSERPHMKENDDKDVKL